MFKTKHMVHDGVRRCAQVTVSGWYRDPLRRDLLYLTGSLALLLVATHQFAVQVVVPVIETPGYLYRTYVSVGQLFGSTRILQAGLLGIWVGVVILWTVDTYKRLLTIGPVTLGVVWLHSVGFSWWEFLAGVSIEVAASGILFVLLTLQMGGLDVIGNLRRKHPLLGYGRTPIELRRGPYIFFLGVLTVVVAAVLDHYAVLGPTNQANPLLWNVTLGMVVVGVLYPFIRYDNDRRVIQLGPGRSGKTSTIGGMYCDIRDGSRAASENRSGRRLVGNQLEGISERLTEGQKFPSKTQKSSNVSFEYYKNRRLFRRKNTILTFDNPGQLLTGLNGNLEKSYSAQLNTYRNRRQSMGGMARFKKYIERVLGVEPDPWLMDGDRNPNIGRLLDTADTIVFTLPLDDFLTPTFKRRNTISSHGEIFLVEPSGSDDREEYTVIRPWGDEFKVYRNEDGELACRSGEVPDGLSFDAFDELPLAPSHEESETERRYCTSQEREPLQNYLAEYRELIRLLWEDGATGNAADVPQAVWVATMSDLVYDDFRELYRTLQEIEDGHATDGGDTLQFLRDQGIFTNRSDSGEPESSPEDYTLFGRWILQQCVQQHVMELRESAELNDTEYLPDVRSMIERTGEQNVYPVWFDVIREDDFNRIESDKTRLLNGSNYLFDRLEGQRLPNPWYHRYKSTPPKAVFQRFNPFTALSGNPLYEAAVGEMERVANERATTDYTEDGTAGPMGEDGDARNSTTSVTDHLDSGK